MSCNNFCKSTLTAYTNTTTTVIAGGAIPFTSTYKNTGSSISYVNGSTTVNLRSKGLYQVFFSVTGTATGETAGNITVTLYRNGVAVPSTITSSTSTSTTDFVNLENSTIIEVDENCPCSNSGLSQIPLTLVSTGEAVVSNASITVVKLA